MPPKRRFRNGSSNSQNSTSQILKSLITTSLSTATTAAAAAASSTATTALNPITAAATLNQNNNNKSINFGGGKFNNNNKYNEVNGVSVAAAVGLTTKQLVQQQLDRNNFLASLTKDQLRFECRKRGQKTSGTKQELLQRLGYKMSNQFNNINNMTSTMATNNTNNNNTTTTGSQQQQQNNLTQRGGGNKQNNLSNGTIISNNSTVAASVSVASRKKQNARDKEKQRSDREKLVLWRQPILTLKYCFYEIVILLQTYRNKLLGNKIAIALLLSVITLLTFFYHVPGEHQIIYEAIRSNLWFVIYWVGLGVLSSVGLGTGLHTFLLYLGPHIASVTLAAYECSSLNFPQPPYPDEIICPEVIVPTFIPSLWAIMSKVRPEAFLWGAGTALGELPPYFMAKAARLSGYDPEDDEDLKEFEELQRKLKSGVNLSLLDRAKLSMERIVERIGFLGILACASIPNPLFDLAGITCGHFLVPFWTFFGATLIGKAVIKMHIQKVFVIIAFNESLIEKAVDLLGIIPILGRYAQEPFKTFLAKQKSKLHRSAGDSPTAESNNNLLAKIFEYFVVAMVCYFVLSIVNSLAQSYHKRIHKKGGRSGGGGGGGESNNSSNNINSNNSNSNSNNKINNHRKIAKD